MKIICLRSLFFLFLIFALSQVSHFAQGQPQQLTPHQQELADYITTNYTKREASIPMRDGVKLFTVIYEPKSRAEKYPIMLSRTPYTVAPYGKDKEGKDRFKTSLGPSDLYSREGFIFVYQDVS